MFKEANIMHEKQSEFINNRDKGKYKVKDIVNKYCPERPHDIVTHVADYVNEKVEIRQSGESGRGVFAI